MWNLKVPKRIFFYWGAPILPFLRYMSIYSFAKLNPDWEVKVYVPFKLSRNRPWHLKQFESDTKKAKRCYDYTFYIKKQLDIKPIIFDFGAIGLSNDLNEVHKSDFLRYHLLAEQGGVWADMDVLFIKPIDELLCNKQKSNASAFYYHSKDKGILGHAIGFLMSAAGSRFFSDVLRTAKNQFTPIDYQGAGPDLLNKFFPIGRIKREYPDAESLDKDSVYTLDLKSLYEINRIDLLGANSVGVHWYGGYAKAEKMLLGVNRDNYLKYPNNGTLMKVLRQTFPSCRDDNEN